MKATLAALLFLAMGQGGPTVTKRAVHLEAGGLKLSREGYQLILNHEVGGGASYYSRHLSRPTYPGGASGVTIGIGYDLGHNSTAQIALDWSMLAPDVLARLQSCAGYKGSAAKRRLSSVRSIRIPWDFARQVYEQRTIPRFAALTRKAYPGVETLHPHIQSANLSWCFNRGSGISSSSDRDREKRAIRRDTPEHPERLPGHYRASKRLWVGRGLDGLLRRREDEARLIESAL